MRTPAQLDIEDEIDNLLTPVTWQKKNRGGANAS